jgi:hypothetical protein
VNQDTILITTCTKRKRIPVPPSLRASSLRQDTQRNVFGEWQTRLDQNAPVDKASAIYCGRAFKEACEASREISAPLWIISAGLGFLFEGTMIPPYNLTITTSNPDSILTKIKGDRFSASEWWREINGLRGAQNPISRLIADKSSTLFVIALSQPYAVLIQDDLLSLPDPHIRRIRLIGLALAPVLDSRLQEMLMPYDERFDGPDGNNVGTRADFAQRAVRHFATEIVKNSQKSDPSGHAEEVRHFLAGRSPRQIPVGRRLSDQEIMDVIVKAWASSGGTRSEMLRLIRNTGIACEQSRFQRLYKIVKKEIQS